MVDTTHSRVSGNDNLTLHAVGPGTSGCSLYTTQHPGLVFLDSGLRRNDDGAGLRKAAESQKKRQGIKSPVIRARARGRPNDRMKGMPLKMAQMYLSPSPSFQRRPACMDAGGRAASGTKAEESSG